ncbi:MAG: hypothetical protein WA876_14250 [Candidatus Acidiferrales bacterium]
MRSTSALLLLALSMICSLQARAQEGPGCGPANIKFDVSTSKKYSLPSMQPGKALIYLFQDDLKYGARPRPTTRFAIDGTWIGATHADSFIYAFVDAGDHDVCANWQSDDTGLGYIGPKRSTAAAHFTAEAGKSYYFRARDIAYTNGRTIVSEPEVVLAPLDSDEARVIISSFSLSSSHPKK